MIESTVPTALIVVVAVQFPLGLYTHADAKRRGIKDPETYALGTLLVPVAGVVVFAVYLSRRNELPKRDQTVSEPEADASDAPGTCRWTVRVPGWRGLPLRVWCTIAGLGRYFWSGLVGVPLVLLGGGVAVGEPVATFYVGASAVVWIVLLGSAAQFTDTTAEIDSEARTLRVVCRFGTHPLSKSPHETEVPLDEVVSAAVVPVGTRRLLRLEYEHGLLTTRPEALLVDSADVPAVKEALKRSGVPVRERGAGQKGAQHAQTRAWATVLIVGVAPIVLSVARPDTAASTPVVLLVGGIAVWLLAGGVGYVLRRLPTR